MQHRQPAWPLSLIAGDPASDRERPHGSGCLLCCCRRPCCPDAQHAAHEVTASRWPATTSPAHRQDTGRWQGGRPPAPRIGTW